MSGKKEKPEFIFPNAKEREKRLGELLPAFVDRYGDEEDRPKKFKHAVNILIRITTDKEAFEEFCTQHGGDEKELLRMRNACDFISKQTRGKDKDRIARRLQEELVNGLIRRWETNQEKYTALGAPALAKDSREGQIILDMLDAVLRHFTNGMIGKAKKRDPRIEKIPLEDMRGEAHELLLRCTMAYRSEDNLGHFKSYYGVPLKHFGGHYERIHSGLEEISFSALQYTNAQGKETKFSDTYADPRESEANERAIGNEYTTIVRELIGMLGSKQQSIIGVYLTEGKKAANKYIAETYGIKSNTDQHLEQALRMFRSLASKDPRLKDIASGPEQR